MNLSDCARAAFLFLLLVPRASAADDDTSIGDDYDHSSNVLISTAEATSTTAVDATLDASSEATTEATSGPERQDPHSPTAVHKFAKLYSTQLAKEFAQGRGEKTLVLATLLKIPPAEIPAFLASAQRHYEALYPTPTTEVDTLIERLATLRPR